ncbi:MAG: hypothetical protein LM550_10560 [Candidatus Contendobacter sp.]|jgi:hypothetical protein|nr:hypothetical protein [Gammaproteobacteria bacterium]MCC8994106.1 hypothetical protein [Candidatus Contendobacter sp.]
MRDRLLSLLRVLVLLPSYALMLLIRLIKWLIAPLALLIQLSVGAPLAWLRVRQPLKPRFIPLPDTELPDPAWIALTDAAETLAADGFIHYGDFRCNELIQGATLWLRLLGQPEQGIGALAAYIEFNGAARPARQFIEFSTEFIDGRVLATNNLDLPYSLPAPTYLARVQLKDVWDPRALGVLHRDLVAALPEEVSLVKVDQAVRDPARLLGDSYAREIQALLAQGWLRPDGDQIRLSWRGAVRGVWEQAWPLAGLHLRAADRRSRQLLAGHGITVAAFTGAAVAIVVDRRPLPEPAAPIATLCAGYEYAQCVAKQTDPKAELEAVTVELERDATGTAVPIEFRYSFWGCSDQPQRRIRRLRSFDILLDLSAGLLAVTTIDREFEQATDEAEWAELTGATSMQRPLRLGPWLADLDTILPTALPALNVDVGGNEPDSASLYIDEEGHTHWQVVAWTPNDLPLHVVINARTGLIIERSGC